VKLIICLFVIFGISLAIRAQDETFFKALHQIETSGRIGNVIGDNGRSLGPFQISRPYWLDATEKRRDLRKQGYGSVARKDYAEQIVRLYFLRYERRAVLEKDYETLARLHNSGPNWRKKKHLTDRYWNKFKKELDR